MSRRYASRRYAGGLGPSRIRTRIPTTRQLGQWVSLRKTLRYIWSHLYQEYGSTGYGCQSCSWSAEQGKFVFHCPRSRLRIWSRETGSAVPSSVSLLISILRLNLVLTNGIPPEFCHGAHLFILKPPPVMEPVPSLSGQAIAYR